MTTEAGVKFLRGKTEIVRFTQKLDRNTMQADCANATRKRGSFPRVWEENRRSFASGLVNISAWKRLDSLLRDYLLKVPQKSGEVETSEPVVIMASRRMPRVRDLIRRLAPDIFNFRARFYSDFALEFLDDSLEGRKVAIVDDAVNVGSTMLDIQKRVEACRPREMKCFALARKAGEPKVCDDQLKVEYARIEELTEDGYRSGITALSRALWLLNSPRELEFPLYRHTLARAFLADLPAMLENHFGGKCCHRLDIAQASWLGLHRYSVDLEQGRGVNNKVRLYVDESNCELVITPMAHCLPHGNGMRAWRAERFKASMSLYDDFAEKLGLPERVNPCREEAALLFGTQDYEHFLDNVEVDRAPAPHTGFYESRWPLLRGKCLNHDDNWSMDVCFRRFFMALARDVGENSSTDYDRLRRGPTFGELVDIMRDMWTAGGEFSPADLHRFFSPMLDRYIDLGFVVPVLDANGCRRFRKGEPYAWNDASMQMLRAMGIIVEPGGDMDRIINSLSQEDRGSFNEMWRILQAQTTNPIV